VNLQAPELLIILVVILLLFGSTKLPKLARSLGQAQKEFKEGIKENDASASTPTPEPPPADPSAAPDPPANGEKPPQ
jgi:sec-independent protein translocase protein TatA